MKNCLRILTITILISFGTVAVQAETNYLTISFDKQTVSQEVKALTKNGVKFVNLPFLTKYLHAVTDWDHAKGELRVRFGKLEAQLQVNSYEYTENGEHKKLNDALFEQDGQLWIPIEYLKDLGITVKNEEPGGLDLGWKENYLLGMERLTYQGRPAFLLVGGEPLKTKSFLLSEPNRLVLDLTGIKVHPAFDNQIKENQAVAQVRFRQMDDDTLRLVFDLKSLVGYKLIRSEKDQNLLVVFNYFVEAISLFKQDQERKVLIKTTYPAQYQVEWLDNPRRLVIDFDGANLAPQVATCDGDGRWIGKVRMSQYTQDTVRVVLDLLDNTPTFIVPSREDPQLITVRTIQDITRLIWNEAPNSGQLFIESNGAMLESVHKLRNPARLQIDFDCAKFATKLRVPAIKSDQVKGVRLIPINNRIVRLELDLAHYVGYTAQFSPDRRNLTLGFQRSPLIDKTIVLDAGHGGVDPGACGRQGTREKDINLEVTLRLQEQLEEAGAHVILTRGDDTFISLYERSFLANYLSAALFLSIHTNYHSDFNVHGVEVYHFPAHTESKPLAKYVHDQLIESTGLKGLGVKTNDFVVIRETQMPGILVELGFLSNFEEENLIRTEEFREKAATGIFEGIVAFFDR